MGWLAARRRRNLQDHRGDRGRGCRRAPLRGHRAQLLGDASRPDLLHSAGLHEAEMLVVAIDDRERALEIVKHARMERDDLHIVVRAYGRNDVYDFFAAGANDMIRETFDSAVRAGRSALEALGVHPHEAEKICRAFNKSDRAMLREMADVYDPDIPPSQNPAYVAKAKEVMAVQDAAMRGSRGPHSGNHDRAWMPPGAGVVDEIVEIEE